MSDCDQPRRTPEYKFCARAEIIIEGSGAKQLCDVKELSLYGCYLDSPEPLSPKTHVLLKIYDGQDFLRLRRMSFIHILRWAWESDFAT
jgi:hypothetical protein